MGLAEEVVTVTELRNKHGRKTGKTRAEVRYKISDEGHAQEKIDSGEAAWVRPPSRTDIAARP
jgi:hypothetical protein